MGSASLINIEEKQDWCIVKMIILIRLDTMNATQWKGGSRKGKPAFLRHCFAATTRLIIFRPADDYDDKGSLYSGGRGRMNEDYNNYDEDVDDDKKAWIPLLLSCLTPVALYSSLKFW